MKKSVLAAWLLAIFILWGQIATATTLVDTLNKKFKKIDFPYDEVTVQITITTKLYYLRGNRNQTDFFKTLRIHEKLVHIFRKNGWFPDNPLLTDVIDVGKIELEIGEGMNLKSKRLLRLKAFVHQCDHPRKKYRGGDINEFFENTVLKKAEKCFTYDEGLQGRNYPY